MTKTSSPRTQKTAAPAKKPEMKKTEAKHMEVLGGVAPYLTPDNARKAAEFYKKAFAAEEVYAHPADEKGRTMHIHLVINGGSVMLCDPFPEHGHPFQPPQAFSLHLQVEDIDAWWKRAVTAGAEVVMPVELMFWGDRYGQLRDPHGFIWTLGQHV
jgi:uncharacterized glyoxalase superfamily protein PhnB